MTPPSAPPSHLITPPPSRPEALSAVTPPSSIRSDPTCYTGPRAGTPLSPTPQSPIQTAVGKIDQPSPLERNTVQPLNEDMVNDSAPDGLGTVMQQSESQPAPTTWMEPPVVQRRQGMMMVCGLLESSHHQRNDGMGYSDMDGSIHMKSGSAFAEDDVEISEDYAALFGEEEGQDKLQELEW